MFHVNFIPHFHTGLNCNECRNAKRTSKFHLSLYPSKKHKERHYRQCNCKAAALSQQPKRSPEWDIKHRRRYKLSLEQSCKKLKYKSNVQISENFEAATLQKEVIDDNIVLHPTSMEIDKVISKGEINPILPVELVTISVGIRRNRKSVFSCLNVLPSFKKLKSEYLHGVKEELQYRSSLNTETLTYTSVPSEIETHTSNFEWPKIEVDTDYSKKDKWKQKKQIFASHVKRTFSRQTL